MFYKFSSTEKKLKDFRNYQMPWKLFENLRDGDINPKEVLRNQARFKSDLNDIKIGGNKSLNQGNTINSINNLFDLREKVIIVFRDYSFFTI